MNKKNTKYDEIEASRTKNYGDPLISHVAIGLGWEGKFRNRYQELDEALTAAGIEPGKLFPPDLVCIFLADHKTTRAARPVLHQDSYDDNHVFLNFSERFRKE